MKSTGETDLANLLRAAQPQLHKDEFVFASLESEALAELRLSPICTFEENEGTTVIISQHEAIEKGIPHRYPCRLVTLSAHSSLDAVGLLATIAQRLAERGISVNAVSAYYHDHFFVPIDRAQEAIKLLAGDPPTSPDRDGG